ncbi:MAG: hypothetical protein KJP04_10945 [Arenicella sp.]|nr:hypothetical protein [Arenicella sp.]
MSAIAVVVSLVFVGFEIRNSSEQVEQNTQALQISAYQDLIGRIVEINTLHIEEGHHIESLVALEAPTEEQTQILTNYLWILFRHGDMAYFQFQKGAISERRMRSAMAPLVLRLEFPQVREHWQKTKAVFVPEYQVFIDGQIKTLSSSGS